MKKTTLLISGLLISTAAGAQSVMCLPCQPGTYNDGTSTTCKPCETGGQYMGATTCATFGCPEGFYCAKVGSNIQSFSCPVGSYCPANSTAPITCWANNYCPAGSSAPTACPSNSSSIAGSSKASDCIGKGGQYCAPMNQNKNSNGTTYSVSSNNYGIKNSTWACTTSNSTKPTSVGNQCTGGAYCWCAYSKTEGASAFSNLAWSSWVFYYAVSATNCANNCAYYCARDVNSSNYGGAVAW
jgi:hypothetical protein